LSKYANVDWDDFPRHLRCPKCGSRKFDVEGRLKVNFSATIHIDDEGEIVEDYFDTFGVESEERIINIVICAECGENLTKEVMT